MERYPVAGKVIGLELWFGISFRDALEAFFIPILVIFIPRYIPLVPYSPLTGFIAGAIGIVLGVVVLYLKNDAQRPLQYLIAVCDYYLTTNEYFRRGNRDENFGKVQEVFISQQSDTQTDNSQED